MSASAAQLGTESDGRWIVLDEHLDSVVTASTLRDSISSDAGSPSGSSALGPPLTISELFSSESDRIPPLSEESTTLAGLELLDLSAESETLAGESVTLASSYAASSGPHLAHPHTVPLARSLCQRGPRL